MEYKRPIHDKLITDFRAFEFSAGVPMFNSVEKIFKSDPESLDCLLVPGDPSNTIIGNTSDSREYQFSSFVCEFIEDIPQEEATKKIDRLSFVEDTILAYLQQIPNPLRNAVSDIDVYQILVNPSFYTYEQTQKGYAVVQRITFTVQLVITPQLL